LSCGKEKEEGMSELKTPFRYDYVGSFLRPEKLKEARKAFDEGKIDYPALKKVEDECIAELVAKLKALDYRVITDGEFRRATWHLDFMWGFSGVGHEETKTGLPFHGENAMIDDTYLVGKVALEKEHPFVEHFRFLKQFEDSVTVAKQTIPAPAQFYAQFIFPLNRASTAKIYKSEEALADDIVAGYEKFIDDLYKAGCRNLQLDDCTWGMFADPRGHLFLGIEKEELNKLQVISKDINNRVINYAPKDMIVNTHICRGNFRSTWFSSGGYEPVAKTLFGHCRVDGFFLEYDSDRAGDFTPLRYIKDQKVVLGLITSKSGDLEDKDEVIARIKEASQYVSLEQLCLSPQCGFSSTEEGNILTIEAQWDKLKLIDEIVHEVWG